MAASFRGAAPIIASMPVGRPESRSTRLGGGFRASALLLSAVLLANPARAEGPDLLVKLRVRVARCPAPAGGAPRAARPADWVTEHIEATRALLAPHGVALTAVSEPFTPSRCELLTRRQRDALAADVVLDETVNVLVVDRVRDLAVPTYNLKGVHWRAHGRRWIFLTASARPPVLAHELAHYFGLPHDPAGGNLMTPGPSSPAWQSPHPPAPFAPVLTPPQVRRLRAGIRRFSGRHAAQRLEEPPRSNTSTAAGVDRP
jgi:hypothetical protein